MRPRHAQHPDPRSERVSNPEFVWSKKLHTTVKTQHRNLRSPLTHPFNAPFDWHRTIRYIGRYENDQTHAIEGNLYRQVLGDSRGYFLVEVEPQGRQAVVARIVKGRSSKARAQLVQRFLARTFGPDNELLAFYRFARKHLYLSKLARRYRGLRLVGVVSLWECLTWSIIGQQVSVQSAFATRSRLAFHTGSVVSYQGRDYTGFPIPEVVAELPERDLRSCGFSRQKAGYVKSLAQEILSGDLDEDQLHCQCGSHQRKRLLSLRGIGPWSADYAMMRVHGDPDACPLEDIGLRNALRGEFNLRHQPTMKEVARLTEDWKPFRSYGTFYIWYTLLSRN